MGINRVALTERLLSTYLHRSFDQQMFLERKRAGNRVLADGPSACEIGLTLQSRSQFNVTDGLFRQPHARTTTLA
jgi:hypothetical protein